MESQIALALDRDPAVSYERYFVPAIGAPLARNLVDAAGPTAGESVLDLACGTGVVARLAAERVGDSATVAGIDVDAGMLRMAREAAAGDAVEWHQASARAGALRETGRVRRRGGRVAFTVPGPTPPVFAELEDALGRHLGPGAAAFVATVFSLHDPDELRDLFESAGFSAVEPRSERKRLRLPAPGEFVWQYLHATPLASAALQLDDETRASLQREVVADWLPFTEQHGGLAVDVDMTTVTART